MGMDTVATNSQRPPALAARQGGGALIDRSAGVLGALVSEVEEVVLRHRIQRQRPEHAPTQALTTDRLVGVGSSQTAPSEP
jgi:hypothetical protein